MEDITMHRRRPVDPWNDEAQVEDFKPLTREEAEALRSRLPKLSPWRVVKTQAVAGLVCVALAYLLTQRGAIAVSALWGAGVVVVSQAVLARGISRFSGASPGIAVFGFMFWELMKIGVAIALLALAVRVVPELNWPALLVTMLVCMKVSWLAAWRRGSGSGK